MEKKSKISEPLTLKEWVQRTFSDHEGIPSFKRQLSLVIFLIMTLAVFSNKPVEVIEVLAFLVGGVLGITGAEKFTKNKKP